MSDVKGIEVSDILGLSEPLAKLIETVSAGIGKLYEPTHIKRMAKAKAIEIGKIEEAIISTNDLPTLYNEGKVTIDGTDYSEILKRAENRIRFQEIRKQRNIDLVVFNAAKELNSSSKTVSADPVDIDWTIRFFQSVDNLGSAEMLSIWAKLLAGEIIQPGSFSLRTLDVLKNLTSLEAQMFQIICSTTLKSNDSFCFVFSDKSLLNAACIKNIMIAKLEDCGLINATSIPYKLSDTKGSNNLYAKHHVFQIINKHAHRKKIYVYPLTTAGCELFNCLEFPDNKEYFISLQKFFSEHKIDFEHVELSHNKTEENQSDFKELKQFRDNFNSAGCFLTSACMKAKNLPDNCHELETLRDFRDNWLQNQPNGPELIQEYYRIAPQIVSNINANEKYIEIYDDLYEHLVLKCVNLIETGQYMEALKKYKTTVDDLKNVYLNLTNDL